MEFTNLPFKNSDVPAMQSARSDGAAATASSDFKSFLKLLTAQLRNQDPLSPLDSTQFVEQLASFSAVEQQIETNTRLKSLTDALAGSGLESAAQWIGKEVETAGGAAHFDGEPLRFAIPESAAGQQAEIVVSDSYGNIIYREATGQQRRNFVWNGETSDGVPAPVGDYAVAVNRYSDGSLVDSAPAQTIAKVVEARMEEDSVRLVLSSGLTIAPDAITAIRSLADEDSVDPS